MHWKLEIWPPGHPKEPIKVFETTLDEDNPIKCAMQAIISAEHLVPGINEVMVTYLSGGDGKLLVSDIVVHFHVDK